MLVRGVSNKVTETSLNAHKKLDTTNTNLEVKENPQTDSTSSTNVSVAGYGHTIGRGIYGRDCYPVNQKTTPELEKCREIMWKVAHEEKLDPFETQFWVMKRDTLLQTASRTGFPIRYRHWSFGQAYQESLLPQKHGMANLYELVINNEPCYAYLLEENPFYAQKVVMAHVMGHSDFFKNNYLFSGTNRKMLNRMGDHAGSIQKILDTKKVSFEEMERFIDKVHSIQWLIDLNNLSPRKLNTSAISDLEIEKVPDDFGKIDVSGLPSHMEKRINDHTRILTEQEQEEKRRENGLRKLPPNPERDVLAFIIENSYTLKPWQRHVLSLLREESYYFAPQLQTKIMNEGWASYWHTRLMKHPGIMEPEHATDIGRMFGNVMALPKLGINPYALGLEIFLDIEEKWNKGQHGPNWDAITDMKERKKYDTGDMKGLEKIFEIRRTYKDVEFLRTFFTEDVARKLKMYTWDPESEDNPDIIISSKYFDDIKNRLIEMLDNGGQPLIQAIDGNHDNRGELRLEHIFSYELKQDYAETTLENIKALWGRPVHLDTYKVFDNGAAKPMRISILNYRESSGKTKNIVKRYILKENKEIDYECDVNGDSVSGNKSGVGPYWGL